MKIPHNMSPPFDSVTISAGIATTDHDMLNPEELLNRADQSLYRAKEKGRNRVEVFGKDS
jgi:diguanylate cyclase (GGDEF)-like protein